MANRHIFYNATGTPNLAALKFQLESMRGIISMDIDSETNGVAVDYDDAFVNETQISRSLNEIGYQKRG